MNPEELREKYAALSTQELLEIFDNKFNYTELSVAIALEQLAKRQVSEEEIKDYKVNQIEKATTIVRKEFLDDLNLVQKNLFYFIWLPLFTMAFKQNFREDGYLLKLKQTNYYSIIGAVMFFITILMSVYFDFSTLPILAILILGFLPAYAFDEMFNRQYQIKRLLAIWGNPDNNEADNETDDKTEKL